MLHHYLEGSIKLNAEKVYIKTKDGSFTYDQVHKKALFFLTIMKDKGIKAGDRVLIYSSKNVYSIALMMACSMCEAVYIPVSSLNPALRAKYIIDETDAKFVLCDDLCKNNLLETGLVLNRVHNDEQVSLFMRSTTDSNDHKNPSGAFILFTSGSTGTPKGVVISQDAAMVFINWAADEFRINKEDVLASIAPFNFDLSVFDIYVSARSSATLVLYSEDETKNALLMAQHISLDKVTTIYATPTFYSTLALYGKMHKYNYSSLKNVLFAGEVFHLENFKSLLEHWPDKKYSNLYGPTETNVCTFFNVDTKNINYSFFPIGKACDYAKILIVDEEGNQITNNNTHGELLVTGKSLFNEYWADSNKTQSTIFIDENQTRFYKTGDVVYKNADGNLVYVGRNDQMIKKNGFRIEPLEIERVMMNYPAISNVALCFSKENNQLCCFYESETQTEIELSDLKKFCQNYLPAYMIPDKFVLLHTLPKTSSGKIDLHALNNQL